MKTFFKRAAIIIGILVVLVVGSYAFSTYDYGFRCTKCLRDSHVVDRQLFGITYWRTSRLRFEGHDLTPIFGHPCEHVFRKSGFGQSFGGLLGGGVGCGITGEGGLFQFRWASLKAGFKLDEKMHDSALLKQTFEVVDSLLPADATLEFYKTENRYFSMPKLALLSSALEKAENRSDWEAALTEARKKDEPITSN